MILNTIKNKAIGASNHDLEVSNRLRSRTSDAKRDQYGNDINFTKKLNFQMWYNMNAIAYFKYPSVIIWDSFQYLQRKWLQLSLLHD